MSVPVKIAIAGASGRMGRMLIEAVLRDSGAELHAAFEREGSEFVGRDPGEFVGQATSVRITTDVAAGVRGANCLIDFTRPEATLVHLEACQAAGVGMVIGTTGFEESGKAALAAIVMGLVIGFLGIPTDTFWELALTMLLGGAVYLGLLYAFGAVNKADLSALFRRSAEIA